MRILRLTSFSLCFFAFLLISTTTTCQAQKTDTVNGVVYFQLKNGLCRDAKNNIYFFAYDSVADRHVRKDVIYKTGSNKHFKLRDIIDTATFYRYEHSPYAKDKKHAYFFCCYDDDFNLDTSITMIEGADVASFKVWEKSHYDAEDTNYEYLVRKNSFRRVSKYMHYKNIGKGFYLGNDGKFYIKTNALVNVKTDQWSPSFYREVPTVDLKTYTDFGNIVGYAKDKKNVYWRWGTTDGTFIKIVENADPLTFKVNTAKGYTCGHDKNFNFVQGSAVK